ncbi:DUF4142 domain-containing protein [Sphingomonas sp. MMS24-J45]|uniref:DUF4142 domain-containing protein n=1 Tax=Sphingomonas sp. MMS24-J45 TaxID=3238806 RepID=UPI00384C6A85
MQIKTLNYLGTVVCERCWGCHTIRDESAMKTLHTVAILSVFVAVPALAQADSASQYVTAAGASDLFERQSAQVVMQTTTNAKVRSCAKMMLTAHSKSTADVKAAAARSRVKVMPPKLMPDQAAMLQQLRAAKGTDRDTTYVTQQKAAHDQALTLHQSYASNGRAAPLKTVAAKIVPVVQMHIRMLDEM